jgi:hypothetical protein
VVIIIRNSKKERQHNVQKKTDKRTNYDLIRKQYNISSTELSTEYTLTIKQHKSHAKIQTKIAKKYRQKRRTVNVIIIRNSKKDRQHNVQKKTDKRTNYDLINTTHTTKD